MLRVVCPLHFPCGCILVNILTTTLRTNSGCVSLFSHTLAATGTLETTSYAILLSLSNYTGIRERFSHSKPERQPPQFVLSFYSVFEDCLLNEVKERDIMGFHVLKQQRTQV